MDLGECGVFEMITICIPRNTSAKRGREKEKKEREDRVGEKEGEKSITVSMASALDKQPPHCLLPWTTNRKIIIKSE